MLDEEKYGFYPWLKWTFNLCDFLGNSLPAAFIIGLVACITIPLHIIELPFYYAKKYSFDTPSNRLHPSGARRRIEERLNTTRHYSHNFKVGDRVGFYITNIDERLDGRVIGLGVTTYGNEFVDIQSDSGIEFNYIHPSNLILEEPKPIEIKQTVKKHDFR